MLLIEQFVHVALALAESAYVIEGGRIVYHGTAAELKEHPRTLHSAYLLRERAGVLPPRKECSDAARRCSTPSTRRALARLCELIVPGSARSGP